MSLYAGCICSWKDDESCYHSAGSAWYRVASKDGTETWRCIACRGEWSRVVGEGSIEGGKGLEYDGHQPPEARPSDLDSPTPAPMCADEYEEAA